MVGPRAFLRLPLTPRSASRWSALGLALLFALGMPAPARGQTCSAQVDRSRVAPGERLVLTVTMEGAVQDVAPPTVPVLDGVDIRTSGTSRSFELADGQLRARVEFTYVLDVRRDQPFTIPALSLRADGRVYTTRPIPIEVTSAGGGGGGSPGGTPPRVNPAPAGRGRPAGGGSGGGPGRPGDPVFVTLTADRQRAWVGEQVVVSFRFHRRVPLWDAPQYQAPRSEGFWREDLPPERTYSVVAGGARYDVTEIRYALFPTRAGRLTIAPAEVTLPADPFARFDRFFGRPAAPPVASLLRTSPLVIEVAELPSPRPEGFSGMVATRVALTAHLSREETPRGEPVTATVELEADGFVKSLAGLPLPDMPEVEVHDAGDRLDIDRAGDHLVSRYRAEKVLVPQVEGRRQLPPLRFTYFDAARGRYATVQAELGALSVGPGGAPIAGGAAVAARPDSARPARELAFLHAAPSRLRHRAPPWPARPAWWLAVLAAPVALGGLRLRQERERRAARDPAAWRRARALVEARRLLRRAARARAQREALTEVARAVTGYVGDRTGRPAAAVGEADVRRFAAELGRTESGERLAALLGLCDEARFSGREASGREADARALPATIAGEAARLLEELNRAAARGSAHRAVPPGVALLAVAACGLAGGAVRAAPADSTPAQSVVEGNAAYTAGDDATAVQRYRAALASGVDDPVVHYNLGNAHARRGELGRAAVCYLRARRLAPRDPDVRANLALTLARARDRDLLPRPLPPGVAQVASLPTRLSLDEWSAVTLVLVWACAALIALRGRRRGAGPGVARAVPVGLIALSVAVWITAVRYHGERAGELAAVVVPEAEVRSGPGTSFPIAFRVHDGLLLTLRGRQDDWVRIGLGGEWVGWLSARSVELVRQP